MALLIDASYIIALLDPRDQWHAKAKGLWPTVAEQQVRPLTHTFVVAEAVSVVGPRRGGKLAQEVYDTLWEEFQVVEPDRRMLDEAMGVVLKFDGALSLSDGLSVLIARRRRVRAIVSFDSDFDKAGVERLSDPGG
jgi:predicted nucleic acid-binding protein